MARGTIDASFPSPVALRMNVHVSSDSGALARLWALSVYFTSRLTKIKVKATKIISSFLFPYLRL